MAAPRKILIVRLSSIGDIILTSPIIRSLAHCHPHSELHFLTKPAYASLLDHHPALTKVHQLQESMEATIRHLDEEGFDFILDLHRNLRSARLKLGLGLPSATYSKDRLAVLLKTRLGWGELPEVHTVERYARTLPALDCTLDAEGLDLYLAPEALQQAAQIREAHFQRKPIGVVLGGGYATKRWPTAYFIELLEALGEEVMLLGGPDEAAAAAEISRALPQPHLDATGKYPLAVSAALVRECRLVLTHDTGLMHVAAVYGVPIVALWGNTVPEFGFYPYRAEHVSLGVDNLSCRPCTKLGHAECPKGHFKCMADLRPARVLSILQQHPAL